MTKADIMLLERVAHGEVSFTYEPNSSGKVKLVRSTTSGAQQPKYHALALKGFLAEKVDGTPGHSGPPTTTVSFTLTAAGRAEMGIRAPHKPLVNWRAAPTDAEMEREGIE